MPRTVSNVDKYRGESIDQVVDFTAALAEGALLTLATATVTPSAPGGVEVSAVTVTRQFASFRVSGGAAATSYTVDLLASASNGEMLGHRIIYAVT